MYEGSGDKKARGHYPMNGERGGNGYSGNKKGERGYREVSRLL